ncbi:MAG: hypothetical protein BWY49_00811 [Candidatus Omnitrophica bacterium ADurb.Bin314]|nr:MAG: hypothetical protein BWY49_00811 [Candidatus Omnitrophica bacterium ADurb.Bin314]
MGVLFRGSLRCFVPGVRILGHFGKVFFDILDATFHGINRLAHFEDGLESFGLDHSLCVIDPVGGKEICFTDPCLLQLRVLFGLRFLYGRNGGFFGKLGDLLLTRNVEQAPQFQHGFDNSLFRKRYLTLSFQNTDPGAFNMNLFFSVIDTMSFGFELIPVARDTIRERRLGGFQQPLLFSDSKESGKPFILKLFLTRGLNRIRLLLRVGPLRFFILACKINNVRGQPDRT